MNISRSSIIFIICAIIVLGGAAYYFFFYTADTGSAVVVDGTPASDAEIGFISLVGKLGPITFDTAILSDPRFLSRTDIRTTIVPETAGRRDPFAPFPGAAK